MLNRSVWRRFWSKVELDEDDSCWNWRAATNNKNYGKIFYRGRLWLAHHIAYMFANGKIPRGKILMHRCDNPRCVNPNHLVVGTHRDNVIDMINKGRRVQADFQGEKNRRAKLTENDVRNAIGLTLLGYSRAAIGKHFGVSRSVICDIIRGNHWRNIVTEKDVVAMSLVPRDKGGHRLKEVQIQHGR